MGSSEGEDVGLGESKPIIDGLKGLCFVRMNNCNNRDDNIYIIYLITRKFCTIFFPMKIQGSFHKYGKCNKSNKTFETYIYDNKNNK